MPESKKLSELIFTLILNENSRQEYYDSEFARERYDLNSIKQEIERTAKQIDQKFEELRCGCCNYTQPAGQHDKKWKDLEEIIMIRIQSEYTKHAKKDIGAGEDYFWINSATKKIISSLKYYEENTNNN